MKIIYAGFWAAGFLFVAGLAAEAAERFDVSGTVKRDAPLVAWSRPQSAQTPADRVRIAFYNIEHFTDAVNDGPERTPELARAQAQGAAALLSEIDPDVVLISEVENARALNQLNEAMAKPFAFGWVTELGDGTPDKPKLNFGLLSRLPPIEVVELDFASLQGNGRPPRGSLRAMFDLGSSHRLVVYGVHLKSNFGYRPRNMSLRKNALEQVVADAREVQKDQSVKWELFVVGDVNVDPEGAEFAGDWSLRPLKGWRDLWRGRPAHERITVPTRYGDPALEFPPATFDRIFAGADATNAPWVVGAPGVLPRGCNTRSVNDAPGANGHISDHYPVWVDVYRAAP